MLPKDQALIARARRDLISTWISVIEWLGSVLVVIEFPVESRCQFVADFQSRADQRHLGLDEAAVLLVRKRTLVDNTRDRKGAQRFGLGFAVFRPGSSVCGCFGIHDMPDLE